MNKFVSECSYSVESVKQFKKLFLKNRNKFDANTYDIVSFDVVSMYNNINTERFLDDIIPKIYKNPKNFFQTEEVVDNKNRTFQYPPKTLFRKFFENILHDYSSFSTLTGYFKQSKGLSMGSKISGAVANYFMDMLEKEIITKHIKNKNVTFYVRYVDDIYCFIKNLTL